MAHNPPPLPARTVEVLNRWQARRSDRIEGLPRRDGKMACTHREITTYEAGHRKCEVCNTWLSREEEPTP